MIREYYDNLRPAFETTMHFRPFLGVPAVPLEKARLYRNLRVGDIVTLDDGSAERILKIEDHPREEWGFHCTVGHIETEACDPPIYYRRALACCAASDIRAFQIDYARSDMGV